MQTCDTIRARLAALAGTDIVPADVVGHATGCPACAGYARTLARVDELVPQLPVPAPSPGARQAVLELALSGPIIVPRPAVTATPSGVVRLARAAWAAREQWQYAAGVAAVLAVGLTLWQLGTRPGRPEVAGARHELLGQQVRSLARLSTADTADAKVAIWTDAVGELAAATRRVHGAADPADLEALDRMFAKAVSDGLVKQAQALPPNLTVPDKKRRLKAALDQLAAVQAQAEAQSTTAPIQAVPTWKSLARSAAAGRAALLTLTEA